MDGYRETSRLVVRIISMVLVIVFAVTVMPLESFADDWWSASNSDTAYSASSALDPDDPLVDETRIVAIPKGDTTSVAVRADIEEAATELDVLPQTEIISNPTRADRDSVVVVESSSDAAEGLLEKMRESNLYESIDYDVKISPAYVASPNDALYRKNADNANWGLRGFPGAQFSSTWPLLNAARGNADTAPIAVIDTGFDLAVEDRGPNIVAGYDFGSGDGTVGIDAGNKSPQAYHGTATAGLIGAATNNARGIAGAAWDNRVIVYKASDKYNDLYLSAVTNCINDVVAKRNAKIISMSLGGPAFPSYFKQAIDEAIAADILVIASAGNHAQEGNPVIYPAAYAPVLSVGAIDSKGKPTSFSSYNNAVDIAAPGENILAMDLKSGYKNVAGTSFSCPYVAAAAALVWRMAPGLSAQQVQNVLRNTAISDLQAPARVMRNPYTGDGTLDAFAAANVAQGFPMEPTIVSVAPDHCALTVDWEDAVGGMTKISNFVVSYRPASGGAWSSVVVDAATHSVCLEGLQEGERYVVAVSAKNSLGVGPKSTWRYSNTFQRSITVSKSSIKMKAGKSVALRVGVYYPLPAVMSSAKISWKSSKKGVATVSSFGKKAAKAGKGVFRANSLTGRSAVRQEGKKVTIKAGNRKGTAYVTFVSGRAKKQVKVSVK